MLGPIIAIYEEDQLEQVSPEFAVPKLSPLWWAEIKISSA
jgi:hypothetical protein